MIISLVVRNGTHGLKIFPIMLQHNKPAIMKNRNVSVSFPFISLILCSLLARKG